MSPTALFILQALLQHGPELARTLVAIHQAQRDPTPEEWEKIIESADKSYADYIAEAQLRKLATVGM